MTFEVGLQAALVHNVGDEDTATAMGTGDLPVLSTPRLLGLCEAACVSALATTEADAAGTTVGTRVELEHLHACVVGETVHAVARLDHVDGRLLRFEVVVTDEADRLVARAILTRVVVDPERFLARASQ